MILPRFDGIGTKRCEGGRMDYLGFILVAFGLGSLPDRARPRQQDDWFSSNAILAFTIVSALALAFLFLWEFAQEGQSWTCRY